MARVSVDIIRKNNPPRSGTHYAWITIAAGLPVPEVGDDVVVVKGKRMKVVRVERRLFHYSKDALYLQLFFKHVE